MRPGAAIAVARCQESPEPALAPLARGAISREGEGSEVCAFSGKTFSSDAFAPAASGSATAAEISPLMMTPRLTVAAMGEDAAAGVADCAGEFEGAFDSEAGSGTDFVSSDLRHMGTSQTPKPRGTGCAGQPEREAKVVHGKSGVKRESSATILEAKEESGSPAENQFGMPREEFYFATPV